MSKIEKLMVDYHKHLKTKIKKVREVEKCEYLYAVRDFYIKSTSDLRFIKHKKYKISNVVVEKCKNTIVFEVIDESGYRQVFDYRVLDKDNLMYLFDTLRIIREEKIKSIWE